MSKRQTCSVCGCWIGDERMGNRSAMCKSCYLKNQREISKQHRRRNGINAVIKKTTCGVCGCWIGDDRINGSVMCESCWREYWRKKQKEYRYQNGGVSLFENSDCPLYLSEISEELLCMVFRDVIRMPHGNPGFDFLCGKGFKIDAKISSWSEKRNRWDFAIRKNIIADYFACIAIDNRQDINIIHWWLIPGHVINHLTGLSMTISRIPEFAQYEQEKGRIYDCCNEMRNNYINE